MALPQHLLRLSCLTAPGSTLLYSCLEDAADQLTSSKTRASRARTLEAGDRGWSPCGSCVGRALEVAGDLLQPLYVLDQELWLPLHLQVQQWLSDTIPPLWVADNLTCTPAGQYTGCSAQ